MSFFPKIAEAAVLSGFPTLTLLDKITKTIINPTIKVFMGIALAVFLWGVFQYIKNSADGKDDKEEGKNHMFWGIIGLFIMVSAMGILNLVNSFWTN